jgi:hypothetical protein
LRRRDTVSRRKQDEPEDGFTFLGSTPAEFLELKTKVTTLEAHVLTLEERHEADIRQIERRIGRVRIPGSQPARVEPPQ